VAHVHETPTNDGACVYEVSRNSLGKRHIWRLTSISDLNLGGKNL